MHISSLIFFNRCYFKGPYKAFFKLKHRLKMLIKENLTYAG